MKGLELEIYDEEGRVIIEMEYKGVLYTEEFNNKAEDVIAEAKSTVSRFFDEIEKEEELRPYEREEMQRRIFLELSRMEYLTKDAIAELLDL